MLKEYCFRGWGYWGGERQGKCGADGGGGRKGEAGQWAPQEGQTSIHYGNVENRPFAKNCQLNSASVSQDFVFTLKLVASKRIATLHSERQPL